MEERPRNAEASNGDDPMLNTPEGFDSPEDTSKEQELEDASANTQTEQKDAPVEAAPKPTANDAASIPDGGLKAWLQVVGGFMIFFNTWGLLNTYGVYQTYYESGALFTASSSDISWVGSIQAYSVLLGGLFTGRLFDAGYLRSLIIVGSFGVVFGHMMLSLCKEFWQVLLAQGFLIGLSAGTLFTPGLAVIPTYFRKKMGLAIGLAAAGSSFGGIIYPIAFYRLINEVGFGWSVRILGFIALATLLIPIACLEQRVQPKFARAIFDWSIFTDWPFVLFMFGSLLGFMGLYAILFYISYFGQAAGITDESLSFYLVAILNAGSMFGRTLPNYLADKFGPFNLYVPGAAVCGILAFSLISVHTVGGIVVVALFFGFFSGVFIALPPVLMVGLTKDKSKVGTRMGMGFALIGLGVLAGGPGGGAILGQDNDWTALWSYGGACFIASTVVNVILRMWQSKWKLTVKV